METDEEDRGAERWRRRTVKAVAQCTALSPKARKSKVSKLQTYPKLTEYQTTRVHRRYDGVKGWMNARGGGTAEIAENFRR